MAHRTIWLFKHCHTYQLFKTSLQSCMGTFQDPTSLP
jgi:hypothetical protein